MKRFCWCWCWWMAVEVVVMVAVLPRLLVLKQSSDGFHRPLNNKTTFTFQRRDPPHSPRATPMARARKTIENRS